MAISDVLVGVAVALVVGVIMAQVVDQVITDANFTGMTGTIAGFLLPMFFIGLLILAVSWTR